MPQIVIPYIIKAKLQEKVQQNTEFYDVRGFPECFSWLCWVWMSVERLTTLVFLHIPYLC